MLNNFILLSIFLASFSRAKSFQPLVTFLFCSMPKSTQSTSCHLSVAQILNGSYHMIFFFKLKAALVVGNYSRTRSHEAPN